MPQCQYACLPTKDMLEFHFLLNLGDSKVETWKPVAGFPRYEVSDRGAVRSTSPSKCGHEPKVLKARLKNNGYVGFVLSLGAFRCHVLAHRLVAEAFLPPMPRRPWVNHKDGNKLNNCVENLEWSTPRQNNAHATARGVRHAMTNPRRAHKLTAAIVAEIRATVPRGRGAKEAAARFGISTTMLQRILANRSWRIP